MPNAVPTTAWTTLVLVESALLLSTSIVPTTTQKPRSTRCRWVTATARANPAPMRRPLCAATERAVRNALTIVVPATVSDDSRSAKPVGGSRRPRARAHTGRASAAAAAAMTLPVKPMVVAITRHASSCRPVAMAAASSGALRIR